MSLILRHRKLGGSVTFRVDEPELEDLAADLHSASLVEQFSGSINTPAALAWNRSADGCWQILLKGVPWDNTLQRKEDLYLFSDSLLDDLAREPLGDFPLLHAGALVSPQSKVAVICGHSGAGKTSLTLSGILRGWDWLSDELLCFRQDDPFFAEGCKRNFNLKEISFSAFPATSGLSGNRELSLANNNRKIRFFNPGLLPGGRFSEGGRISAIIFPEYKEIGKPEAAPISGPALVEKLFPELRTNHQRSITWMAQVARKIPAFTVRYKQPNSAMDCVASLLEQI